MTAPEARVRAKAARDLLLSIVAIGFGVALVLSLDRISGGQLLDPAPWPSSASPWERPPWSVEKAPLGSVIVRRLRAVAGLPILFGWVGLSTSGYRLITGIGRHEDRRGFRPGLARVAIASVIAAVSIALVTIGVIAASSHR